MEKGKMLKFNLNILFWILLFKLVNPSVLAKDWVILQSLEKDTSTKIKKMMIKSGY